MQHDIFSFGTVLPEFRQQTVELGFVLVDANV